jgi:hypothetical protein
MPHPEPTITTIDQFVQEVDAVQRNWKVEHRNREVSILPWFRGEAGDDDYPLTPTLFRVPAGKEYDENWLLQNFRQEAPILNLPVLPEFGRIDQWMFLARHVNLPTRLLDWTEGALIALNFALRKIDDDRPIPPVVWMLNPFKLITLSVPPPTSIPNIYPLTWTPDNPANIGLANFIAAWGQPEYEHQTSYPVPIRPAYVHQRMIAQLSCFTIHGRDDRGLRDMLEGHDCLVKFIMDMPKQESLERLRTLGITYVNIMPDADGLAEDIKLRYPPSP